MNLDRTINQEALMTYTRGTIAKKECLTCGKDSGIMTSCVTVTRLLKDSCCNCHYNSEEERCSFRSTASS